MSESISEVQERDNSLKEIDPLQSWERTPDKRRAWGAVISYPLYFIVMIALAVPVALLTGGDSSSTQSVALGLLIPLIAASVTIWVMYKRISFDGDRNLKDILLLKRPGWRQIFLAIAVGILCQILLALIAGVLSSLGADLHSSATTEKIGESQGTLGKLFVVFCSAIAAPFLEELFFRGFIFNNLAKGMGGSRKNVIVASLFSASAFAFMHIQGVTTATDFLVLGWTFTMGLIMCWLVRRTGSMWVSFTAHMVYNGFIALVLFT